MPFFTIFEVRGIFKWVSQIMRTGFLPPSIRQLSIESSASTVPIPTMIADFSFAVMYMMSGFFPGHPPGSAGISSDLSIHCHSVLHGHIRASRLDIVKKIPDLTCRTLLSVHALLPVFRGPSKSGSLFLPLTDLDPRNQSLPGRYLLL